MQTIAVVSYSITIEAKGRASRLGSVIYLPPVFVSFAWVSDMVTHNEVFDIERPFQPSASGTFRMSNHAMERMYQWSFSPDLIRLALTYGQPVYDRGARIYRLGKKHVKRYAEPLLRRAEGVHAVCGSNGLIFTVYRNHTFRRPRKTYGPSRPPRRSSRHRTL